jgi:hypothetical protein
MLFQKRVVCIKLYTCIYVVIKESLNIANAFLIKSQITENTADKTKQDKEKQSNIKLGKTKNKQNIKRPNKQSKTKPKKKQLKTDREKTKPTNNDRYNILTIPISLALQTNERCIDDIISFTYAPMKVTDVSIGRIHCVRHLAQA